jgi:hypothetical protein
MALKLLKPPEARAAAEVRDQEDLRRADSIHDVTKQLLEARAKAERDFEKTLAEQRLQFDHEQEERRLKKANLLREVEDLEDKRERALIPIIERETKLHNDEEALRLREEKLDEREASLEDEGRVLMQRLDEVSDAESKAKDISQRLVSREKGVKAQEESVAAGAKQLSSALRDFEVMRVTENNKLAKWEAVLDGRELALQERIKTADRREKEQDDRDLRLKDRYDTLIRTQNSLHASNPPNTGK